MNQSYRSKIDKLREILDQYHAFAQRNKQRLEDDPLRSKKLLFWIEGTRFLITELEVWEQLKNEAKCEETIRKIQKAINQLQKLADELG